MLSRAIIVFVCFVGGAGLVARANQSEPVAMRMSFDQFPIQINEWRGVEQPKLDQRTLEVLGADDYVNRAYFSTGQLPAGLFIAYYQSQRQGDTMHSPLNCLPGSGWEAVSRSTIQIPVTSGPAAAVSESPISVNRYIIQKGLDRQLVLYWYQSHGRVVASEYWGKYYLIRDSVRLHRTDGALVRVVVPIRSDVADGEANAEGVGVGFVKSLFPQLGAYLPA